MRRPFRHAPERPATVSGQEGHRRQVGVVDFRVWRRGDAGLWSWFRASSSLTAGFMGDPPSAQPAFGGTQTSLDRRGVGGVMTPREDEATARVCVDPDLQTGRHSVSPMDRSGRALVVRIPENKWRTARVGRGWNRPRFLVGRPRSSRLQDRSIRSIRRRSRPAEEPSDTPPPLRRAVFSEQRGPQRNNAMIGRERLGCRRQWMG
jgi:hypothetical protein